MSATETIVDKAKTGELQNMSSKELEELYLKALKEQAEKRKSETPKKPNNPGDAGYVTPDYNGPPIPPHIAPYVHIADDLTEFAAHLESDLTIKDAILGKAATFLAKAGPEYCSAVFRIR